MKNSILLCLVTIVAFSCNTKPVETHKQLLPVIGEKKLGGAEAKDTIYHTIPDFAFLNQYNDTISQETVENKIYVADFFFATCQSICPQMSSQLVHVQKAFATDPDVLILSHTVNPMHDTVEVLKGYADSYGAQKNKWHFLTGNKKEIYAIAKDGYLINALEDDGTAEGFLHSELFLLIDRQKRIRGMYDGTDSVAVAKLIADIRLLKQEQ